MIRTQISVEQHMYLRAKEIAKQQGISLAELCRRALDDVISRQPSNSPWMQYSGSIDGSSTDSTNIDDVVYGRSTL